MSDEVLFQTKYLTVIRRDGWYEFTKESDTVAFVIIIKGTKDTVVRMEKCPAHGEDFNPTVFSGMIDKEGESPEQTAIRELEEEAGYTKDQIKSTKYFGTVRPSKAQDTTSHLFLFFVEGDPSIEIAGDGTKGEEGAHSVRMPLDEAINVVQDPRFHAIVARTAGQK